MSKVDISHYKGREFLPYSDLYGEAMAFPLIKAADLDKWVRDLEPNIQIKLDGVHRKKPSPFKDDRVFIISRAGLGPT